MRVRRRARPLAVHRGLIPMRQAARRRAARNKPHGVAAEGTILGPLSAESLAGLATVAAGFAGAAAAFGLVFIPSANGGVTSQRAVPGEPGLNYSLNHEEGSLIITRNGPAGDETVAAAHLGQDGVFRGGTGAPIAPPREQRRHRSRRGACCGRYEGKAKG